MVEMVLSVALERTISKRRILSCYVNKIYWGHGIYGIESASDFYFGKPPSLLTLGESALLAGIIPAPELRSPFRDPTRGKTFQARVLKRMVEVGFLDIETALSVLKQPLYLLMGQHLLMGFYSCHLSSEGDVPIRPWEWAPHVGLNMWVGSHGDNAYRDI
ncbi:Penicillin-binding protein 1A [Morus notabilis]|uniref:Penicillin-binding protein 1A n=1 Tax=Morus notabilis TaxID=981085 RepID=W9QN41_9ROSA|nr:Penicillin-binding protein 1A [Morus notabilis]